MASQGRAVPAFTGGYEFPESVYFILPGETNATYPFIALGFTLTLVGKKFLIGYILDVWRAGNHFWGRIGHSSKEFGNF